MVSRPASEEVVPRAREGSVESVYQPGDPIPCPDAVEDDSESAWALWNEAKRTPEDGGEADTQPMDLIP